MKLSHCFWDNAVPITETGCLIWMHSTNTPGYGQLWRVKNGKKKLEFAHRVAYELANGEIPVGSDVLHRCDVKCCIEPTHLYLGNHRQNMLDFVSRHNHYLASRTHCNYGHPFTEENTIIRDGRHGRRCRACLENRTSHD